MHDDLRTQGVPTVQSSYQTGVGLAAFELDLFGRVRYLSEAAFQEYLATREAALSVQIILVADIIQTYLAWNGALQRYRLAARALEARKISLELIDQCRWRPDRACGLYNDVTRERKGTGHKPSCYRGRQ